MMRTLSLAFVLAVFGGCKVVEPTIGTNKQVPDRDLALEPQVSTPLKFLSAEPTEEQQAGERASDSMAAGQLLPPSLAGDEVYQLELRGKSVAEALHLIAEVGGLNMYLDSGLDSKIDASFPSVRLQDALDVILAQNELDLVEDPPGIYWVVSNDGSAFERAQFRVQSVNLTTITPILEAMVGGETTLVVDAAQNLVVVNGIRSDIEGVAEYLDAADRLKRQVFIEARLVEVILDDRFELGVSLAHTDLSLNGNALALMQQFTTPSTDLTLDFTSASGDFTSTVSALQQYVGLEVISSPRVAAVNGAEANIEIVTEVPFIQTTNTTTTSDGDAGTSTFQEVQFKEAGIRLKVTPVIQEDRVIEMIVEQELSEVVDFFVGVPVLDTRKVSSTFQIEDQKTLVIGGLMQDSITKTDNGIPFLMDLPLVGRFFKSDVDVAQKRELVLFLTPRIVDSGNVEGLTDSYREVFQARRRELGMEASDGRGEAQR